MLLDWDVLVDWLILYVVGIGFIYIELLLVSEYFFGGFWGY